MMTLKKMIIKGEVLSENLERCTNAAQISDRTTYVVAPESQCEDYSHQNNRQKETQMTKMREEAQERGMGRMHSAGVTAVATMYQ